MYENNVYALLQENPSVTMVSERMATGVQKQILPQPLLLTVLQTQPTEQIPSSKALSYGNRTGPGLRPHEPGEPISGSVRRQSLTFHRSFLFLILRVDHHGAQL